MSIIDDFESGTLTGWTFAGDANWVITSNPVYEGIYAAKSGAITHNQVTRMYRNITITEPSILSFYWKVSSEANYDFLKVYIDNFKQSEIAGEVDWTRIGIPLDIGTYELKFEYIKDSSVSGGSDAGYVDYITLEPYAPGKFWMLATTSANWSARAYHKAIVYDNKMWVLGGYNGIYKNDVWFSTDGATWWLATTSADWSGRNYHEAVAYNNKMWVLGGRDSSSRKNDVWYSTDGITWWLVTASANWSGRYGHGAVVYNNKMWVLGGYDIYGRKNDVWYSTDGVTWTLATASANWSARAYHKAVVYDNKMWVLGGYDGLRKNDVWFSTDGVTWTLATASANWSARVGHEVIVHGNKMWVLGGYDGIYKNDVWFSTDGVTWTLATASADWSVRRYHEAVGYDNKIWVLGGYDGIYKNDVWYTTILQIPQLIYVNSITGDDLNAGDSCTAGHPVKTFAKAYGVVESGGTIHVCNSGADFSGETVTLNKSFYITMVGTGYFYGPKAS